MVAYNMVGFRRRMRRRNAPPGRASPSTSCVVSDSRYQSTLDAVYGGRVLTLWGPRGGSRSICP